MANKRQIADERDYAAMGVNELLRASTYSSNHSER